MPAKRVYHLNCGTLSPHCERLINGKGSFFSSGILVCHCLLIETNDGLVLVDTGFGMADIINPYRMGISFNLFSRPKLKSDETAIRQVEKLGFKKDDVKDIILTHMDVDHVGGLSDFPDAKVHVYEKEYQAATNPLTFYEKNRYGTSQWEHNVKWERHKLKGESWYDFESITIIKDKDIEIHLIPLNGHSRGHCGVAVSTDKGWILHCGDAFFYHGEIFEKPECTPGLTIIQLLDDTGYADRLFNQKRLREFINERKENIQFLCSHDPLLFSNLSKSQ